VSSRIGYLNCSEKISALKYKWVADIDFFIGYIRIYSAGESFNE